VRFPKTSKSLILNVSGISIPEEIWAKFFLENFDFWTFSKFSICEYHIIKLKKRLFKFFGFEALSGIDF